jgi:hypothetical protein
VIEQEKTENHHAAGAQPSCTDSTQMKIKSLTREKHNLMYMYLCSSKKIRAEANRKRKERSGSE